MLMGGEDLDSRQDLWQPAYFTHVLNGEESCHCLEIQPDDQAKSLTVTVEGKEVAIPGSEE